MHISLNQIKSHLERWVDTSYLRFDDKTEYREKKEYGNRHAVFEYGAILGKVHYDKFNATDVPVGTVRHFSNYVEEKSGIPQGLVNAAIILLVLYATYKTTKWTFKI